MPLKTRYDELSEHNPSTLVLQLQGGFYHAYDDSAKVLAAISGYKLREKTSGKLECGFPINALEKNISLLDQKGIRYIAFNGETVIKENSCDGKRYEEVLGGNLPPPVVSPSNRIKDSPSKKESANKPPDLVNVQFRCPKELHERLMKYAGRFWDKSLDAVISEILMDGIKE